jgi:uncharacterized protein YbaP (TraB family)
MKKAIALADRSSAAALWALALANLLFVAAVAATLVMLSGQVEAADSGPACSGANMLAEIKSSQPDAYAKIDADAAATKNGAGLLWKIEKAGLEPSFLFGTMHMTDPRVVNLTPEAQTAFDAAQVVVIETTDVLDQAKLSASLMASPDLMMFTDQTTLTSLLAEEDKAVVEKGLTERGIPLASVIKMKPWMLAAMVSLPACEMARKAAGEPMLDIKLARQAQAAGKELGGLETAKSQLEAMASLPIEFHIEGLVDTLKLGTKADDISETMIVMYQSGDTGKFIPFMRAAVPAEKTGDAGYAAFEEKMINARNGTMAANAEPYLAKGKAFIAVGALHLPGDEGVIEKLRRAGYTISRAD